MKGPEEKNGQRAGKIIGREKKDGQLERGNPAAKPKLKKR